MKRFIALFLGAVLTLSAASCGTAGGEIPDETKEESVSEEVTLTFMYWGNQTRTERTTRAMDAYTEANPEVTFELRNVDWADYWTVLATSAAGGNMPDLVQMDYEYINAYAENGRLVDLGGYYDDGTIDVSSIDSTVLNMGKVGDTYYALCNGTNVPALLYDKEAAERAGVEIRDNMSLREFEDAAQAITDVTGETARLQYRSENFLQYVLRGMGKDLYNDTYDNLGCTAVDLERYFEIFEEGTEDGWMMPITALADIDTTAVEQDPFILYSDTSDRSWCTLAWSNQITAYLEAAPDDLRDHIGAVTWPADDPILADYVKPSQFWAIGSDSEHPDTCAEVINYLTNSVSCNEILMAERGIPVSSEVREAIEGDLDEGSRMSIRLMDEVMESGFSETDPASPSGAAEFYELADGLIEKIGYGLISSEEAAETAYAQGCFTIFGRQQ